MTRPPRLSLVAVACVLAAAIAAALSASTRAQSPALDTKAIEAAFGKTGQMTGAVYKVTFPRSDLHVKLNGLAVRPGLALTGWAAFEAIGTEAVTHGDLALAESEVNPVITRLREQQIEVMAIHNHLLGESPRVMYVHMIHGSPELYFMHFWENDTPQRVAAGLKAALDAMGQKPSGMRQ